jgi:hypothetical protein
MLTLQRTKYLAKNVKNAKLANPDLINGLACLVAQSNSLSHFDSMQVIFSTLKVLKAYQNAKNDMEQLDYILRLPDDAIEVSNL